MKRARATWLLMLAQISCGWCLADIQAMEDGEIRAMGQDSFRCAVCGGINYLPSNLLSLVAHVRPKIDPDNPPNRAGAWDALIGNPVLKRAMEVALVGHHTLAYVGSPDNGWANVQQILGARAIIIQKCPCGNLYDAEGYRRPCTCKMSEIEAHRKSRPFQAALHADIIAEAVRPRADEFFSQRELFTSVLERIKRVRFAQAFGGARMDVSHGSETRAYLGAARDRLGFDADQIQRVQRVAVSIAELAQHEIVQGADILEAISYRTPLLDVY